MVIGKILTRKHLQEKFSREKLQHEKSLQPIFQCFKNEPLNLINTTEQCHRLELSFNDVNGISTVITKLH